MEKYVIAFQGEEIAMEDIRLTFDETRDERGKAFGRVGGNHIWQLRLKIRVECVIYI